MKEISKVLVRTLVKEFYKENAGFFLVVLGFGFGFLKTPQHMDIASALAFKPLYYLVPLALWILYTLKTLSFCSHAKRLPSNWFLSELIMLKARHRKPLVIYLQILLLVPVLGYSIFLAYIAVTHNQWTSAGMVIIANGIIILTSAHLLHQKLIHPSDTILSGKFKNWTHFLPRKYSTLFIHHAFHRLGLSLIFTKVFSLSVIIGSTAVFEIEGIDTRYLALGILISAGVNAAFTFKHQLFDRQFLPLFRNLPISQTNLFLKDFITYLLFTLPEILVFTGNNLINVSVIALLSSILLLPVLLLFYKGITVTKINDIEQFSKYVFFITVFLFFVILGYVNLYIIALITLLASLILYLKPSKIE